jgi:hypothetical protein
MEENMSSTVTLVVLAVLCLLCPLWAALPKGARAIAVLGDVYKADRRFVRVAAVALAVVVAVCWLGSWDVRFAGIALFLAAGFGASLGWVRWEHTNGAKAPIHLLRGMRPVAKGAAPVGLPLWLFAPAYGKAVADLRAKLTAALPGTLIEDLSKLSGDVLGERICHELARLALRTTPDGNDVVWLAGDRDKRDALLLLLQAESAVADVALTPAP